jgi:hypothetical protein
VYERRLQWAGAGVLAAGVWSATIAGAGVAAAEDGASAGDAAGGKTAEAAAAPGGEPAPSQGAGAAVGGDDENVSGRDDKATKDERATGSRHRIRQSPLERAAARAVRTVRRATAEAADAAKDVVGKRLSAKPPQGVAVTSKTSVVAKVEAPVSVASVRSEPVRTSARPNPVESVTAAVSSAVTSLLNPQALLNPRAVGATPLDVPGAQSTLWTLAAAARREVEDALESPVRRPLTARPDEVGFTSSISDPAPVARAQVANLLPAGPTPINIIGTLVFGVFDAFSKAIDVPPTIPKDSKVSFGRSTVEIDCGPGYTADADWYYPSSGTPDKLIYFQHGFLARSFFYDVTLRELAERNNAIVVAPSITSNYFDCNGCSLTGDPMEKGVAQLFEGDRAELAASAKAAGFKGTLPDDFVFAGQSAGGILAAGAAGYFYDSKTADKPDLVGVLLYDTSASAGALEHALKSLPAEVPVILVAGPPAVINTGGNASQLLTAKRPNQFTGVQLVGGAHSDAFQSSAYGGLVQAIVNLGFGASTPENVEAVQVLSQGWLTDMYARRVDNPATRTGIYGVAGAPGQVVIDIPTDAGPAQAYVLPGPPCD